MRNTICISLTLAARAAVFAAVLPAATALAAPLIAPGCWARDYAPAHLADHPDQIVDEMMLRFSHDPKYDTTLARIRVVLADQGHVAGGPLAGQVLEQGLICWAEGAERGCSVECDGGWFTVTAEDGAVMDIRTDYLQVGDAGSCGGTVDLSEGPGRPTTYRLMRVANSVCDERMTR